MRYYGEEDEWPISPDEIHLYWPPLEHVNFGNHLKAQNSDRNEYANFLSSYVTGIIRASVDGLNDAEAVVVANNSRNLRALFEPTFFRSELPQKSRALGRSYKGVFFISLNLTQVSNELKFFLRLESMKVLYGQIIRTETNKFQHQMWWLKKLVLHQLVKVSAIRLLLSGFTPNLNCLKIRLLDTVSDGKIFRWMGAGLPRLEAVKLEDFRKEQGHSRESQRE